jgi:hypothetical protein
MINVHKVVISSSRLQLIMDYLLHYVHIFKRNIYVPFLTFCSLISAFNVIFY